MFFTHRVVANGEPNIITYRRIAVIPIPIVVVSVAVRHDYYGVRDSEGELL